MISGYPHPRVGLQWFLAAALLFMATLAQAQPAPDPAPDGEPQRTLSRYSALPIAMVASGSRK